MEPISLICIGLLVLMVVLFLFRGRTAPAGTYDDKRVESGGSFGGPNAQRTTDSEHVQSGGSFGGSQGQSTAESGAVRSGGSFGGTSQRVEDPGMRRPGLGELEREPHGGKIEDTIPKRPQATTHDSIRNVTSDADSPFPILRNRDDSGDARSSFGERLHSINDDDAPSTSTSRFGSRAADDATNDDDDDNSGDSPRVRSSGSFGG